MPSETRVWFSGRTSAFQADGAGSIPATRSRKCLFIRCLWVIQAHIAQSVEHFLGKEEVTGSNPVMSSIFCGWVRWRLPVFVFRCFETG